MATQNVRYADLDLNFTPHPATGDIVVRREAAAVAQSIKNLVLTNFYERPFHSDLGGNVTANLFEFFSPITAKIVEKDIRRVIKNDEPRAILERITVKDRPDEHGLGVTIVFRTVNLVQPVVVDVFLRRVR